MFLDIEKPTANELLYWFHINFPTLVESMMECNHAVNTTEPNAHHLENSIMTHTCMVLQRAEIQSEIEYNKITLITALLHDIGKPEAMIEIPFNQKKPVYTESNQVRNDGKDSSTSLFIPESGLKRAFRGHEGLSFYRAIEIVNKLEEEGVLNRSEKEQVLTIISMHGSLFDNIKDGEEVKPEKVIAKFGNNIQLYRDFVSQVRNDSTGRFFTSTDGRKNQAARLGNQIFNDNTFKQYRKETTHKLGPKITMLVGVPACGKSTWRDANIQEGDIVISRDSIMLQYAKDIDATITCEYCKGKGMLTPPLHVSTYEDYPCTRRGCEDGKRKNLTYSEIWKYLEDNDLHKEVDKIEQETFRQAVKDKKNIIVDRTNMSAKSRRKWLNNVPKDYNKEAIVFATAYDDIYARNKKRAKDTGKDIKNWIIGNMMRQFMVPNMSEVDSIKWVF